MNKVILIGNLTADPEFSLTQVNSVPMCRFTLAVQRRFGSQEGQNVDFIQIVAWRKTAELCRDYLAKGRKVGVVGSLQIRSWQNNEGATVYTTEVIADEVEFLTPRGSQPSGLDDLPEVKKANAIEESSSGMDLPF